MMGSDARIFVAGHRGLAGSALVRSLQAKNYGNIIVRPHSKLDLTDQAATRAFFQSTRPEYVFLAAAKVGGIIANDTYPAQFIHDNLAIQTSVIHSAYEAGVKRLLFLGTACIYPKLAPQPMKEEYLLTGPLEPTNRAYALAKIAGIEMCWSYNRQYGTKYLAVMPINLFGPGDNYNLETSHVIPALIRKFHEAKLAGSPKVVVWGTGKARREFIYSDDMAKACIDLMNLPDTIFSTLLGSDETKTGIFAPPLINIGVGRDMTIAELAELIKRVVGFQGAIEYDPSKPDGTPQKMLDVSRLKALTGLHFRPLEEALTLTYADYAKNVHGRQGAKL
jgi:GDP-L-fucose synthase